MWSSRSAGTRGCDMGVVDWNFRLDAGKSRHMKRDRQFALIRTLRTYVLESVSLQVLRTVH